MRGLQLWVCLLPAVTAAFFASVTVALLLVTANPLDPLVRAALAMTLAGVAVVLVSAVYAAKYATSQVHQRVHALRSLSSRGQEDLYQLVDKILRGERVAPRSSEPHRPIKDGDPFAFLAGELYERERASHNAVLQLATPTPGSAPDQQVEVFVNVARRMQSLVHREIGLLDDLEAQVEDPELLKGLFTIDHLATRMRRQSESLAVLGGASSRRRWSRPVLLYEVLRSAVAEVEHYSRVKVVPPAEGTLDGGAVADVIHLIAELIENATRFSPPHTQVLLRAEHVAAGLVIEVEDRGLGMPLDDQRQMNNLLADPSRVDIGELLRDGRIGLFVVSALARRHGVKVQLQGNVYGGTQAVAVLPTKLVGPAEAADRQPGSRQDGTSPTPVQLAPAPPVETPLPAIPEYGTDSGLDPVPTPRKPASPEPVSPDPVTSLPEPAASVPEPRSQSEAPDSAQADSGYRPPLPRRRVQTHLAPQLRDAPVPRHDGESPEHSPDLIEAFLGGVDRAEKEGDDVPLTDTDGTSN